MCFTPVCLSLPHPLFLCLPVCLSLSLCLCFIHGFTHSFTHLLTHSLIHSLTHSLTHSLIHSFTHLLIHSLTHSLTFSVPLLLSLRPGKMVQSDLHPNMYKYILQGLPKERGLRISDITVPTLEQHNSTATCSFSSCCYFFPLRGSNFY